MDGSAPGPDAGHGAAEGAPSLVLDGYIGPLDRLLALARTHQVDLARLSLPDLIDQLATAMDRASRSVPLGQRAGWLVLAAWLLQLRSRLLAPKDEVASETAAAEASGWRDRMGELQSVQALATWMTARPQLGRDVFACGQPGWDGPVDGAGHQRVGHQVDVIEFLWAAMTLFDADLPAAETAPVYRPVRLDLHSVPDARERIRRILTGTFEGYTLDELRPPPPDGPAPDELRRRSAWSSTLVACLELAKQGELGLEQEEAFAPIRIKHVTGAFPGRGVAVQA